MCLCYQVKKDVFSVQKFYKQTLLVEVHLMTKNGNYGISFDIDIVVNRFFVQ